MQHQLEKEDKRCSDACKKSLATPLVHFLQMLKQELTADINRIFGCMYTCWQPEFIRWAKVTAGKQGKGYDTDIMVQCAEEAFAEGVIEFRKKALDGYVTDRKASLRTVLWAFCQNMLFNQLRKAGVQSKYFGPLNSNVEKTVGEDPRKEPPFTVEQLQKALQQLDPRCRQLIEWRHKEGYTVREISAWENINSVELSHNIYKCTKKLKALMNPNQAPQP